MFGLNSQEWLLITFAWVALFLTYFVFLKEWREKRKSKDFAVKVLLVLLAIVSFTFSVITAVPEYKKKSGENNQTVSYEDSGKGIATMEGLELKSVRDSYIKWKTDHPDRLLRVITITYSDAGGEGTFHTIVVFYRP